MKNFYKRVQLFLFAIVFFGASHSYAQTNTLSQYVLFSGNGGAGTTVPASPGYGIHLGSPCVINSGNVGSYKLVKTLGSGIFGGNINSGGSIILSTSNSVTGKITAANSTNAAGTILSVGNGAALSGNIDVNGNITVGSGTVSGTVTHPAGTTYIGPAPTGGNVTGAPSLPTLPSLPTPAIFPAAGATNLTTTATITPGSYGNVSLANNSILTLNGPGVYVFNSINNGNNCTFVYNFNNTTTGDFIIYVHGDIYLENFPEWLRMAEARTEFSAKLTELVLLVQMRLQSVTELQQVIQNGSEQFTLRMQL